MSLTTYRRTGSAALALVVCLAGLSAAHAGELRRRGMVGVQLAPVPVPEGGEAPKGVLIQAIVPGGAAEAAGLLSGDIVMKIGETELAALPDFMSAMRGYFAGDKVPFTVKRGDETVKVDVTPKERPRETSDDYEVIYDDVEVNGLRLRTYVTKPKAEGKRPAILLIPSPSPSPIELGPQMASHPYKKLVNALTMAGYVTMRVDRVGVGDSEGGNPADTDLKTDGDSFRSAARKLRTYDYVDQDRVFIYALGMGSAIAPLAAKDAGVRGVATYGSTIARAPSVSLPEALHRMWELRDPEDKQIDKNTALLTDFLKLCEKGEKPGEAMKKCEGLREALSAFGPQRDDNILGIQQPYFLDIARTDYAKAWGEVNAEVLALWGDADYQANRGDAEFIAESVNKAHPGKATFKALPECDHVGNKADDIEDSFLSGYGAGDFNPVIVETLAKWIEKSANPKA